MAEYMYLDGRDDDTTSPSSSSTNVETGRIPAKIFLSRVDEQEHWHRTVIPLPHSYEDATALAVEILGSYMVNPHIALKDVDLRQGSPEGGRDSEGHMSTITPRFWADVVSNNEEIRIFHRMKELGLEERVLYNGPEGSWPSTASVPEIPIEVVFSFWRPFRIKPPLLLFKRTMILPDTYEASIYGVLPIYQSLVNPNAKGEDIFLSIRAEEVGVGEWKGYRFTKGRWKENLRSLKEHGIVFEIDVRER